MQNKVRAFIHEHGLELSPELRFIDLSSETGELGKAILTATDYGTEDFAMHDNLIEEAGDCIFSLLALLNTLDIDAEAALDSALAKYERRRKAKGSIGS